MLIPVAQHAARLGNASPNPSFPTNALIVSFKPLFLPSVKSHLIGIRKKAPAACKQPEVTAVNF